MQKEVAELNQNTGAEATQKLGSGIYVDVENLQGATEAQEVITSLLRTWPETAPGPSCLNLYVQADQVLLWDMWAESQFPHLIVAAKGIQHFSNSQTKNSADIAMAIDAISDILLGRISYVVAVSDDSDFISLYNKMKEEKLGGDNSSGNIPFLWVVTDRNGTRSSTIKDFFPDEHIHVVPFPSGTSPVPEKIEANIPKEAPVAIPKEAPAAKKNVSNPLGGMAQAIIDQIEVGPFSSADCWKIIKEGWPRHSIVTTSESAKNTGATFGEKFMREIFPILNRRGVTNSANKPGRYQMTQAAKDSAR